MCAITVSTHICSKSEEHTTITTCQYYRRAEELREVLAWLAQCNGGSGGGGGDGRNGNSPSEEELASMRQEMTENSTECALATTEQGVFNQSCSQCLVVRRVLGERQDGGWDM